MPQRILVIGSLNRDYVCRVRRIPAAGETLLGGELTLGSGGKGGNQAVAAARMGAVTAMVGCVGDDPDGESLVADLAAAGVDTGSVLVMPDVRTGAAFVMVADDGENSIVVAPGANGLLDTARTRWAMDTLVGEGDIVVLQAEIPLESIVASIEEAARRSVRVVLNLAPFRDLPGEALAVSDPLVVNEHEARALLGLEAPSTVAVEDMARRLSGRVRSVVITAGADGAVMAVGDTVDQVPAPTGVTVVDSTGAGDAFTGALAAALAGGADLRAGVEVGVVAGTIAVGAPGAQASFASQADVKRALEHPGRLL